MDFDSLQPDASQPTAAMPNTQALPNFDQLQDDNEKYGTPGEQLKAGLEGVAQGIAGPLAPAAEKFLGAKEEDIRGRAAANPVTKGLGEAVGFGAGLLTGTGEAAAVGKVGEAVNALTNVAKEAPLIQRVGSSAVQQAAEMAVMQGSDEVSKQILNDPDASAETAIANIGLAAALGGAGGAALTGIVSPLWSATIGPKVEGLLGGLKNHMDGAVTMLPEDLQSAATTLGVDPGELIRGAHASPEMYNRYTKLKSLASPEIKKAEENLLRNTSESVMQATGKPIEDFQNYDVATAGREGMQTFTDEYRAKSQPIINDFNSLTEPFKETPVLQNHIQELSDKVSELAQKEGYLGKDVPQQKIVDAVLNQLPAKNAGYWKTERTLNGLQTAQDIKKLITKIGNMADADPQAYGKVARQMKDLLLATQQDVLASGIKEQAPQLFEKYQAARMAYKDLARLSDRLGSELSIGRFTGPEGFLARLEEKRTPEEFFKKLSPEGNAEILPILQQNFPQTLAKVQDNELKKIVAPAVRAAKGDMPINTKTLQNAIEKKMSGQQAYANWALPQDLIKKTEAAETIKRAIPSIKDSGTAGWIQKHLEGAPATAMGLIAAVTGHNPLLGGVVGHMGELLQRKAPDAINLALLKFAGASEPIKAEGMKSMVDFFHQVYKGENALANATQAMFKSGAQIIPSSQMPTADGREKLDKIVTKISNDPNTLIRAQQGHLGHYLPLHQSGIAKTSGQAVQYLQTLQPHPIKSGPFDREGVIHPADVARYNRALDIALNPAILLKHAADGSLQAFDIKDINAMYPSYYKAMCAKVSNELVNRHYDDNHINYNSQLGISLLIGQPLDPSMSPTGIQSAQPIPKPTPQQPSVTKPKKSTAPLSKAPNQYKTPSQAAEGDRSSRD